MQVMLRGEACAELPACLCCVPVGWAKPHKGVLRILNRTETFPIQSELCSCISISIFTNQSDWLHSNQSGQCFLDQSNCEDLEFSFAWGQTNQGPETGTSLCKLAPLWFREPTFPFPETVSPLELKHQRCQLSRADGMDWSGVEQCYLTGEESNPRAATQPCSSSIAICIIIELYHNQAVCTE